MTHTKQLSAVVFIIGSALLAGGWGYFQTLNAEPVDAHGSTLAPTYPAGFSPVQIEHPAPAQAEGIPGQNQTSNPLSQIWEFNAQQAPELLPQPLTEPNWYISGVVQQGDNTRVMVQFQGESKVRFYKIGDILPGGSKLAWVKPGAIGVITPKRKNLQVPILDGVQQGSSGNTANSAKAPR